jgi:hypothetical protein
MAAMAGGATVVINPKPIIYAVTGGGNYCAGEIGIPVGLSNSESGINYQLYDGATAIGTPMTGIGGAISFGNYTTATTYSVYATNASTGCAENMTGSAALSINPLPVVYNVTGGGNYCAGGIGIPVGLSNSESGINYQLYDGATAIGTPMTGVGGAISFGNYTTATTYSVHATNASTGCVENMTGSAALGINPLPVVHNVTGGGGYCIGSYGSPVGLSNSESGINYQLYDGATAVGTPMAGIGGAISFGNYTTATTYSIQATNASTGCEEKMTGNASVSINPLPEVYSVTGGGSYCAGGAGVSIGLNNSQNGVNYTIHNGAAAIVGAVPGVGAAVSFGSLTSAAIYTVAATNASTGCIAEMTGNATVVINPTPVTYSLSGGGSYCDGGGGMPLALNGTESGINYQLYNGATPVGSPFTGSGVPVMLGLFAPAGIYSITATNPITGCIKNMSGTPTVVIKPSPTVYAVTGGGNYCAGGAGMPVGLANSASGVSYQLYHNTSALGVPVMGSGASVNFGLHTLAGMYTVRATNIGNACTSNMAGVATVAIIPTVTPIVSINSTGLTVCAGTLSTFMAVPVNGGTTPSYEWRVNGTVLTTGSSYAFTPINGDIVKVKMVSSAVCPKVDSAVSTVTMTVNPNVLPSVSIAVGPDSVLCEGAMANFTSIAGNGGSAPIYKWMKNGSVVASGPSYSCLPANSDDMMLSMTSNAPCRLANTVYSNHINMTVAPIYNPSISIAVTPGTTIAPGMIDTFRAIATGGGPSPTFKWFKNSVAIPGATDSVYVTNALANNDSISCKATGSGLCPRSNTASVVIRVKATGLEEVLSNADIAVLPNPNSGDFTISGTLDYSGDVTISVANILGQEVHRIAARVSNGTLNERIVLNNMLNAGMYMLTVRTGAETRVFKVTLQR